MHFSNAARRKIFRKIRYFITNNPAKNNKTQVTKKIDQKKDIGSDRPMT